MAYGEEIRMHHRSKTPAQMVDFFFGENEDHFVEEGKHLLVAGYQYMDKIASTLYLLHKIVIKRTYKVCHPWLPCPLYALVFNKTITKKMLLHKYFNRAALRYVRFTTREGVGVQIREGKRVYDVTRRYLLPIQRDETKHDEPGVIMPGDPDFFYEESVGSPTQAQIDWMEATRPDKPPLFPADDEVPVAATAAAS